MWNETSEYLERLWRSEAGEEVVDAEHRAEAEVAGTFGQLDEGVEVTSEVVVSGKLVIEEQAEPHGLTLVAYQPVGMCRVGRMPGGLLDISPYLPAHYLDLSEVGATLGRGGGRGVRSVAAFDEDTTTMGVAAALGLAPDARAAASAVWFATTRPAYTDKTNATALHAALGLAPTIPAYDAGASVHSAAGVLRAADATDGIAVLSDMWLGLPGSDDERTGGDAAVAMAFGSPDDAIATVDAITSHTVEVLERWRSADEPTSQTWDERFVTEALGDEMASLIEAAVGAGTSAARLVVAGANRRMVTQLGRRHEASTAGVDGVGFAGAADAGIQLIAALERSEPGDRIVVAIVGDGLELVELTVTERISDWSDRRPPLSDWLAGRTSARYADVLTWRGFLERQLPRRPEPQAPAGPPSLRSVDWKFGLRGGRCEHCGAVHAPAEARCRGCGSSDPQAPHEFTAPATIVTMTVDHLAFSPAPPTTIAVVDLGDGARAAFELADTNPTELSIGDVVEPTFRRLFSAGGVHDYFWKMRPPRFAAATDNRGAA